MMPFKKIAPLQDLNKKFNWTLILGLIGAAAWFPYLFEKFSPNEIDGKLISFYGNLGEIRNTPSSLFVLKLGIVSRNQDFNLKNIDLKFKFSKSGWKKATAQNQRSTYFTFDDGLRKLKISSNNLLNNHVVLPKDKPIAGFLNTSIPEIIDEEIIEIQIIFKSFDGKEKILSIDKKNMPENKLLFDDTIWEKLDSIPNIKK